MSTNKEAKYKVGQNIVFLEKGEICEGWIDKCEYFERTEGEWRLRYHIRTENENVRYKGFWCREDYLHESKEALKKYINKQ